MPLNELGEKETLQLACAKLGVRRVPMVVQNIIRQKTQGHPLYIEELVRSLLEEKLVTVDSSGTCHASPQLEKGMTPSSRYMVLRNDLTYSLLL